MQPALTVGAIVEAQRLLDVTLPSSLLDLLRHQNGGEIADDWNDFPPVSRHRGAPITSPSTA
ncbi:SMI1/KNR4 family protein [Streptomyces zhihengii]|uniref:SMI1/KNR4 family protein n=1 Tax=Streptomyces zhihengii TaxID=1818004 RepID=UPI0036982E7B